MPEISSNLMHIGLRVRDYEKSLVFYSRILGFKKMFEFTKRDYYEMIASDGAAAESGATDATAVWLAYLRIKNEQYLELFPVPDEEILPYNARQSFFHLSFQVADIVETVKHLRAHGVAVYNLHQDIADNKPAPPNFVPLKGKCGSLIAWVADPDGNLIELMQLTEESLQKQYDTTHGDTEV